MGKVVQDISILRGKSENVTSVEEAKTLISQLDAVLLTLSNGVGLAAIQLGFPKRVGVIKRDDGTYIHLINPALIEKEDEFIYFKEGCLSFPDLKVKSIRFNEIVLKNNNEIKTYTGELAIIIAHETDHLDGVTIEERNLANINKNDACPCESGKKFKHCHMKDIK
jgi:peptide deformylase